MEGLSRYIQTDSLFMCWDLTIVYFTFVHQHFRIKWDAIEISYRRPPLRLNSSYFWSKSALDVDWCKLSFPGRGRRRGTLGLLQRSKIYLVRHFWSLVTIITLLSKYVISRLTTHNILLSSPPPDHPAPGLPLGISIVCYRICWLELFWWLNFDSLKQHWCGQTAAAVFLSLNYLWKGDWL